MLFKFDKNEKNENITLLWKINECIDINWLIYQDCRRMIKKKIVKDVLFMLRYNDSTAIMLRDSLLTWSGYNEKKRFTTRSVTPKVWIYDVVIRFRFSVCATSV